MTRPNKRAIPPPAELWDGEHAICTYCSKPATLAQHGDDLYPYRRDFGPLWACRCGAYVGCHPGTVLPLGRLANRELREAKKAAHAAFDPFWQKEIDAGTKARAARSFGYAWLAMEMGISPDQCHIGWFDLALCQEVIEICTRKVAA